MMCSRCWMRERRLVVQPAREKVSSANTSLLAKTDAVREFLVDLFGEFDQLFDRIGAEREVRFRGEPVAVAEVDVIAQRVLDFVAHVRIAPWPS